MPQVSSANPSVKLIRYILVIGQVANRQYEPARIDLLAKGFKPKIIRINSVQELHEKVTERCKHLDEEYMEALYSGHELPARDHFSARRAIGEEVACEVLPVLSPKQVACVVVSRSESELEHVRGTLASCQMLPKEYLV